MFVGGVDAATLVAALGYSIHRRAIYKGDTSTRAQGTDPRVALGA